MIRWYFFLLTHWIKDNEAHLIRKCDSNCVAPHEQNSVFVSSICLFLLFIKLLVSYIHTAWIALLCSQLACSCEGAGKNFPPVRLVRFCLSVYRDDRNYIPIFFKQYVNGIYRVQSGNRSRETGSRQVRLSHGGRSRVWPYGQEGAKKFLDKHSARKFLQMSSPVCSTF